MLLSIVIVNHNVRYFVEQCLHSVERASEGIDCEVVIVDNDSRDGSREYLKERFPNMGFIWNEANLGFAKANNQGIGATTGKYILFLNPDTLLSEGCLKACIRHLDANPGTGAVGVRMIDGSGRFLKESKRGFPTPSAALFKLFGLSSLFPKSRLFAKYHLGHLDPLKDHPTEVLSGAFLMVRRDILKRIGGFDEAFFMYGEDIDLSYRVRKEGFSNMYLADHPILHFKGESTEKDNMQYVRMFYSAMSIFARKHYGKGRAGILSAMLQAGIWLRASLSAIGLCYRKYLRPGLSSVSRSLGKKDAVTEFNPSQILVAGSASSTERVRGILSRNDIETKTLARINLGGSDKASVPSEEGILNLLLRMNVRELVICPDYISYEEAMRILPVVPSKVRVSFSGNGTSSVAGSGIRRG
jgi:GT2 family glycosyltransferase